MKKMSRLKRILTISIISPFTVFFWAGSFRLVELFSSHYNVKSYLILCTGYSCMFCCYFLTPLFESGLRSTNQFGRRTGCFLLLYFIACANVLLWKGIWWFGDEIIGQGLTSSFLLLFGALIILIFLRCLHASHFTPILIEIDRTSNIFQNNTLFSTHPWSQICITFPLDALATMFFVTTPAIQVWRSIWNILNYSFSNSNKSIVFGVFTLVGYGFAIAIDIFKTKICYAYENQQNNYLKFAIYQSTALLGAICTITFWYGGWNIVLLHIMEPDSIPFNLIVHFIAFILLSILMCSKTVSPLGCSRKEFSIAEDKLWIGVIPYLKYFTQQSTPLVINVS